MTDIKHIAKGFADKNFNLVTPVILIMSFFGLLWLTLEGVAAGMFYFFLISGFASIMFIIFLFFKEKDATFSFAIPFSKNDKLAAIRYWFGFLIPVVFSVISGGVFVAAKVLSPLLLFDVAGRTTGQNFATISAAYSPFFRIFNIGWVAGSIEEFILGFFAVTLGLIIAHFLLRNFGKNLSTRNSLITKYVIAFAFSMGLFALLHIFNPQYNSIGMFILAAGFRLLMNIAMYFFVGIEFTIGLHTSNNLLFLGVAAIISGIFTGLGLILLAFWLILILLAIIGIQDVVSGRSSWKEIFSMRR